MIRSLTRALGWVAAVFALAFIAALIGAPHAAHAATVAGVAAGAHSLAFGPSIAAGFAGVIAIPWDPPLNRQQLEEIISPQSAQQPELIAGAMFWDTQDIANGAGGPFDFFINVAADKTLSNMQSAGQFPDPQYFQVFTICVDLIQVPTATPLANEPNQALANVENILKTCRATLQMTVSDKPYGPWPLKAGAPLGGAEFSGYGYGTAANGTSSGVVNSGSAKNVGIMPNGSIVIPPKQAFSMRVSFATGVTATVSATVKCQLTMVGNWYRRVL